MTMFFRIILRQDASNFGDIAQMEESSPTCLFNIHTLKDKPCQKPQKKHFDEPEIYHKVRPFSNHVFKIL